MAKKSDAKAFCALCGEIFFLGHAKTLTICNPCYGVWEKIRAGFHTLPEDLKENKSQREAEKELRDLQEKYGVLLSQTDIMRTAIGAAKKALEKNRISPAHEHLKKAVEDCEKLRSAFDARIDRRDRLKGIES